MYNSVSFAVTDKRPAGLNGHLSIRDYTDFSSDGKAVARGGGVPQVHVYPPFKKNKQKKHTISFVEYFVFTPTILNANMFIYHFI